MLNLTIDNQPVLVKEGRSILEACREFDIEIPTLCYHPAIEPYGACRLCMVEIRPPDRPGKLVASCVTPCEEGQVIYTNSKAVQKSRRITAELLLAQSYNSPEILALARSLGVTEIRFRLPDEDNCVLCGLCVRACQEIVGVGAISLVNRGMEKKVSPPFEIISSTCIGCGTCVIVCPTGAITLADITGHRTIHTFDSEFNNLECQLCSEEDFSPNVLQDYSLLTRKPETRK
jgi:bidirectional [NiFe] hydrogenase diaphorase subunit